MKAPHIACGYVAWLYSLFILMHFHRFGRFVYCSPALPWFILLHFWCPTWISPFVRIESDCGSKSLPIRIILCWKLAKKGKGDEAVTMKHLRKPRGRQGEGIGDGFWSSEFLSANSVAESEGTIVIGHVTIRAELAARKLETLHSSCISWLNPENSFRCKGREN